jgi:hypothetical protein
VVLAIYKGRGSVVEVVTRNNGRSNGLIAIDGQGWLRRGLNWGFKAGEGYGMEVAYLGAERGEGDGRE